MTGEDSSTPAWLHRFAVLTAAAALGLIGLGGLVTSHGVGMAVPDWPNTFGYNMFFFPISKWVGGIFYEHTHRLAASGVGLLTTVLALWLYGRSARPLMRWGGVILMVLGMATGIAVPHRAADAVVLGGTGLAFFGAGFVWPRCEPSSRWLRGLGLAAFVAVVLQGVLGGLRVVLYKDQIGVFHATLAQIFFVLLCVIALFTSGWWREAVDRPEKGKGGSAEVGQGNRTLDRVWVLLLGTTLLVLAQLVLGATMRHQHAGLAIPDFPLAYGKLWPAMDSASVESYNRHRQEIMSINPITATQVGLQMVHRMVALLIVCGVAVCTWAVRRRLGARHASSRLALGWLGLIFVQVLLGAATIWSDKAADIATSHVLIGALSLAAGAILSTISYHDLRFACASEIKTKSSETWQRASLTPRAAGAARAR
jgi:cytochrome c oxidase assembly protein subunit 15